MVKVLRSFVWGPLEPHVVGFAAELLRQVWVPKNLSMAWTCSFAPVAEVRDDRQS